MGIPEDFRPPPRSADGPLQLWRLPPSRVVTLGLGAWVASYALSQTTVGDSAIPGLFVPAGIAVALLLRLPWRLWWWVLAVMLVIDVFGGTLLGLASAAESVVWGVANVTQALLLAASLRWARVDLTHPRDPLVIAVAAGVVVALVAFAGASALGVVTGVDAGQLWADWWGADVLAVVLVVPVGLLLGRASLPRGRSAAFALVWLLLAFAGLLLQFAGWLVPNYPVWLWLITGTPLVVLYGVRFGQMAMSGFLLTLGWIAVTFTAEGRGPFQSLALGSGSPLRTLQMVLIVVAVTVQCVSLLLHRGVNHARSLAGQQALLDAVLEGSPAPTAVLMADSAQVQRTNGAFRDLLPDGDLTLCFPLAERPAVADFLNHQPAPGEVHRGEFATINAYGEPVLIQLRMVGVAADDFDRFGTLRAGANLARVIHAEDMTEVRRREALLRHDAQTDPLTGPANRRRLLQVLQAELARATPTHLVSIAYIDLDGFKEVNDRFGHSVGDEVLQQVAGCLLAVIGTTDLVARSGGDEFVVVSAGVPHPQAARAHAEGILKALLNNPSVSAMVGASVGVAVTGDASVSAEEMLRRGDRLMYSAKASGGSCVMMHD